MWHEIIRGTIGEEGRVLGRESEAGKDYEQ